MTPFLTTLTAFSILIHAPISGLKCHCCVEINLENNQLASSFGNDPFTLVRSFLGEEKSVADCTRNCAQPGHCNLNTGCFSWEVKYTSMDISFKALGCQFEGQADLCAKIKAAGADKCELTTCETELCNNVPSGETENAKQMSKDAEGGGSKTGGTDNAKQMYKDDADAEGGIDNAKQMGKDDIDPEAENMRAEGGSKHQGNPERQADERLAEAGQEGKKKTGAKSGVERIASVAGFVLAITILVPLTISLVY